MTEKLVKVFPHPSLAERHEYLPGIGNDGAELPAKQAQDLLDRGLVTKTKHPDLKPYHNADEALAEIAAQKKAKQEAPDAPAEKPEV